MAEKPRRPARPRRVPPRRVRWWHLALAGMALVVLVFGAPLWLWLTVRPPEGPQRAAALAALAAEFPIGALDAQGVEHRVRWPELRGHVPGPCRRDLTLWNPDGLVRGGPLGARMTVECLEALEHPDHGPLRAVLRLEGDRGDGRPGIRALAGEALAERAVALGG